MNYLCIDTSQEYASLALNIGSEQFTFHESAHRKQSQILLAEIETLIAQSGLSKAELIDQLDAICVGEGPGSFVGLRLGISIAQGLGQAWNLPVIPISDTALLAWQSYVESPNHHRVWVCIDARMNEVYSAIYQFEQESDSSTVRLLELSGPQLFSPSHDQIKELWKQEKLIDINHSELGLIGSGFQTYNDLQKFTENKNYDREKSNIPNASYMPSYIAEVQKLNHAEIADFIDKIALPNYVRNQVADKQK